MNTLTLVEQIIANLRGRRGFDEAFDIDDDVMDELKSELASLVNAELTSREAMGESCLHEWVLVPRDPTDGMKSAGSEVRDIPGIGLKRVGKNYAAAIYREMLSYAPNPPLPSDNQPNYEVSNGTASEPVEQANPENRHDALCDSNYAAGMKLGWNLCVAGKDVEFNEIAESRMRSACAVLKKPKPEQAVGDRVAVRWEARRRNRFTGEWGSWQGCDPDTEETVARESVPDEWEFRTLYTVPRPAVATPAEVTDEHEAFERACKLRSLKFVRNEGKGDDYSGPHIQAMWDGWCDRAALAAKVTDEQSEVWVVQDETGQPLFCASWSQACHEHINDAINEHGIDEAKAWKVLHYANVAAQPSAVSPQIGDARAVTPTMNRPSAVGVPDTYTPTDDDVREWMRRSDVDHGSIEQWRTAIDDARSMHLLAAAPEVPQP